MWAVYEREEIPGMDFIFRKLDNFVEVRAHFITPPSFDESGAREYRQRAAHASMRIAATYEHLLPPGETYSGGRKERTDIAMEFIKQSDVYYYKVTYEALVEVL
jgi:alpha-D-ribose 1-methylphosphonate 5-triphosphate synthase subunit PhnL